MRLRKRHRLSVVSLAALAVLCALAAVLPGGAAQGQTPTSTAVVATDFEFTSIEGSAANVVVTAGGNVDFAYPVGQSRHNVVFTGRQPTVCGISQGPDSGATAPMPSEPAGPGWDGGCRFDAPGAYSFVCALHSGMTGSVTVRDEGSTPPSSPPTPEGVPVPPTQVGPAAGPAASAPRVASSQRGFAVRGSVNVRSSGSRLLARVVARRRALVGGTSMRQVAVGRSSRASVGPGRVAFSVSLSAAARRALRRNGRLSISLRLVVTLPEGVAYTATRAVVLRPR